MTITEKIIKMNDKYDKYLEYKNRMNDINIESFEETFNDILHIIYNLEYVIKKYKPSQLDEWSDSFKSDILSLTRDLWNKFVEYQSMIEDFSRKLYSSYLLFEKIKDNLDENEKKQFLSLETIIDNIMKYSNELNAELINNKELFAYVDENTNNNGYEVNISNIQGSIEYSKYIKDFFERITKMISSDNSKKDSRNVMLSKYEKVSLQDGIALIDDTPLKEQETLVDLPFEGEISVDDFVMVHATDFFPENHTIKSSNKSKAEYTMVIDEKKYDLLDPRDTVHFAVNGRVSSHKYGNWDDKKYIIIEPLNKHLEKIVGFNVEDSWIRTEIPLSNKTILMVEESEYEKLTDIQKSEYQIVLFKGDSVLCVQKLLIMLGYKPQEITPDGWINLDNAAKVNSYMKEHYGTINTFHKLSKDKKIEELIVLRDKTISSIRGKNVSTYNGTEITKKEVLALFILYCKRNSFPKNLSLEDVIEKFNSFIYEYGIRCYEDKYYAIAAKTLIENAADKPNIQTMINDFKEYLNLLYPIIKNDPYGQYTNVLDNILNDYDKTNEQERDFKTR